MDTINSILIMSTFVTSFITIVALRLGKNTEKYIFFILNFSIVLWILSMYSLRNGLGNELFFAKQLFILPVFIINSFFIFIYLLINKNIYKLRLVFTLIFSVVFALFILFTGDVLTKVTVHSDRSFVLQFGSLYFIYFFFIVGGIGAISKYTFSTYKKVSDSIQRKETLYIYFAFMVPAFISFFTNLYLPTLQNFRFMWIGQSVTAFWAVVVSFGVLRYDFFGIKVYTGKFIYHLLGSILPFIFLLASNKIFFNIPITAEEYIALYWVSFVLNYIYQILDNIIKTKITSKIINPGFDPVIELNKFSQTLSHKVTLEQIYAFFLDFFTHNLKPEKIAFINEENLQVIENNLDKNLNLDKHITTQILNFSKTFDQNLINIDILKFYNSRKIDVFLENNIKLIYRIKNNQEQNSIVVLGEKPSKNPYNKIEINFFVSLCEIFEAALDRAMLYEKVNLLNKNLEQRIEQATLELEEKNESLEENLRKERDMMDILGHELRTPLGTARNAMVLVESFLKKKEDLNLELIDRYVKIALENIRREKDILQTILASTKLENGRLDQMNKIVFEVSDLVEDSFLSLKTDAQTKNLEFKLENNATGIKINSDRAILQQILDNLVSNAIKYTAKGYVLIKLSLSDNSKVRVSVEDSGEGISAEDLKNIGKKFFRAKQYVGTSNIKNREVLRPGGTGIGLYVVKGLLKILGSNLDITSKLDKGSIFSFELDIYEPTN